MSKEAQMTKSETSLADVIRASSLIRHSSFDIRPSAAASGNFFSRENREMRILFSVGEKFMNFFIDSSDAVDTL
jgi:hypothetical protein